MEVGIVGAGHGERHRLIGGGHVDEIHRQHVPGIVHERIDIDSSGNVGGYSHAYRAGTDVTKVVLGNVVFQRRRIVVPDQGVVIEGIAIVELPVIPAIEVAVGKALVNVQRQAERPS